MQRLVFLADRIERLVPAGQDLAGGRVEVGAGVLVPDRQVPAVILDGLGAGPPDLVVGRGDDLAQFGAGDGAADRDVDVRGEPALRFDGGEVLEVVAGEPAQVLDEPVEQCREVQRVPGRLLVVVAVRVDRCAVAGDLAVGRAGQGHEQGRAERRSVRSGVGLADCPGIDRAAGQLGGVLPAPGGPVTARSGGEYVAADPGVRDLLVQLLDLLVVVGGVEAFGGQGVPVGLRLGAIGNLGPLFPGGRVGFDDGFAVQVPAFAALRGPEQLGAVS